MDKIEYYKTYEVIYKISTRIGDVTVNTLAWPACNDNGEIIWTRSNDNCTIIQNKDIIDYNILKLNNRDILSILYTAKAKFIIDRVRTNFSVGMCFYLQEAIDIIFNKYYHYDDLKHLIPEFIPETFGLNVEYNKIWWDFDDIDSRINAFDKLIEIYKNKS